MATKKKKGMLSQYGINPITLGLVVIGIIVIAGVGINQGWTFGAELEDTTDDTTDDTTPTIPTSYTVSLKNVTGEVLDGKDGAHLALMNVYGYEPLEEGYDTMDDFDQDDWNSLSFADFEPIEENLEHGDTFDVDYTPNVDAWYWYTVTCGDGNGYNEKSVKLYPISSYKNSKGNVDGVLEIELMQKPDSCVIGAISDEGDQSYEDGLTTADVWTVTVYSYEDGELTDDMGYEPYLDFDSIIALEDLDDAWVYPVIRLDFNSTVGVNSTTVDLSGHSYYDTEVTDGNYDVYFNEIINLAESIVFTIDSAIYGAGGTLGITDFEFGLSKVGGALISIDTVL